MSGPTRLRVPAGTSEGGRFASAACPAVYALLDTLAPSADDDVWSTRTAVPAPRCPHGHFARWAALHCTACHPGVALDAGGTARPCGEPTSTGEPCTRRTTRRTCHQHA